jgi:phage gp36-like protein
MAYATPQRFIQEYGLDETTQLLADEQQLLTSQLLTDALGVALGGSWTGTPSAAEQAAANAAKDRLSRKLVTMSNFMDGYLRSAVTLPLSVKDTNAGTLEECCVALVREGVADDSDNVTERIVDIADRWRAWLKDVQSGKVTLITSTGEEVPSRGKVKTGQASSGFNWDGFGAVR